jgi:hypothetical protein
VINLTVESIEDLMCKSRKLHLTRRHLYLWTRLQRKSASIKQLETLESDLHEIRVRMNIVIRVKDLHDYPLLHPKPENKAHVRRPSTIDGVSNVCGSMVGAHVDGLVSVNFDV